VVKQDLCEKHPEAVVEVHRMLREAAVASSSSKAILERPRVWRALSLIIGYTARQGLIPRAYDVEELFDDVTWPLFEGMPR